jgi:hypothetical protein
MVIVKILTLFAIDLCLLSTVCKVVKVTGYFTQTIACNYVFYPPNVDAEMQGHARLFQNQDMEQYSVE